MALVLALAVFLVALRVMATALSRWGGERVEGWLGQAAGRPGRAFLIGLSATAVLQSSSATAAATVALVDAGLLSLEGALAVILGANVGTTITGQIVALPLARLAWPALAAGLLFRLGSRGKNGHLGEALVGFGGLFFGLHLMGRAARSLLGGGEVGSVLLSWAREGWSSVLLGTGLTAVIQSSSATTGLAIALARQGLLSVEAAVGLALGANVGTVATTLLASIGTSPRARRTAVGDLVFNTLGVLLIMPWLPLFTRFLALLSTDVGRQVAHAHTLFNAVTAALALPCLPYLAALTHRIVPAPEGGRPA